MTVIGMDASSRLLSMTESVCPQCLRRIPASRVAVGDDVYLCKECPEHGAFSTVIWRGLSSYEKWAAERTLASRPPASLSPSARGCPYDCGLCEDHRQHTCCVVMEVTQRCNLSCPVCFASAGCAPSTAEPTLDEIRLWCRDLLQRGGPFNIQLSGGEPTLRDDLPEIISTVRAEGFGFVQLNTNGVRLATERDYARRLLEAGLGCVFLQYDGVSAAAHWVIRGRDLSTVKHKAIENCAACGLGVVLVPTIVAGVNCAEIGQLLLRAIDYAPTVRAVHFQPVSYFGRYPAPPRDADRITLPEIMQKIEQQTGGLFRAADFYPASGENAFCEFHGKFTLLPGGGVEVAARPTTSCCAPPTGEGLVQLGAASGNGEGARRARNFVARRWSAPQELPEETTGLDLGSMDAFLAKQRQSFCISAMAFQDAWNLDLQRLKECFLHVLSPQRKLVPLCAYNLTSCDGRALYRNVCDLQDVEAAR
jgi:hypothetical protein